MDIKQRHVKKRTREMEKAEEYTTTAKRRKISKDEVKHYGSKSKKNNIKANKTDGKVKVKRIKLNIDNAEIIKFDNPSGSHYDMTNRSKCIEKPNEILCLASHAKKTYAHTSKRKPLASKTRSKGKQNRNEVIPDSTSNRKFESSCMSERIVGTFNASETSLTSEVQDSLSDRSNENYFQNDPRWKMDQVIALSPNKAKKTKKLNETVKSTYINLAPKPAVTCNKQMRVNFGGGGVTTAVAFSTISSPSRLIASPVTCPVASVLCHSGTATGVPVVPFQSLNTSTSAISSISTPIVALPLLSDVVQDVPGSLRHAESASNSHIRTFMQPDHGDLSNSVFSSVSTGVSSFNIQSQKVKSKCSGETRNNKLCNESTVISTDEADVVLSSDSDSQNVDISIEVKDDDPHLKEDGYGNRKNSPSDMTASPNGTSMLQVDSWADFMLERLEMLFLSEEHCDLILKFPSGKVLKAHRNVISACTSFLESHSCEENSFEVTMPPELDFASIQSILKFVYSGRLDTEMSKTELAGMYFASQKLQISFLTNLLDEHFSCSSAEPHDNSKRQNKRTHAKFSPRSLAKQRKHQRKDENETMNDPFNALVKAEDSKNLKDEDRVSDGKGDLECKSKDLNKQASMNVRVQEIDEDHANMYLLVTNSQKIAKANAAERRKRPLEAAKPTRFELDDDPEHNSDQVATWSYSHEKTSEAVDSSVSNSTVNVMSPNNCCSSKSTSVTWSNITVKSEPFSEPSKLDKQGGGNALKSPASAEKKQPSAHLQNRRKRNKTSPKKCVTSSGDSNSIISNSNEKENNNNSNNRDVDRLGSNESCSDSSLSSNSNFNNKLSHKNKEILDDDTGEESEELMAKISNICKQLENVDSDDDVNDNESNCQEDNNTCSENKLDSSLSGSPLSASSPCNSSQSTQPGDADTTKDDSCVVIESSCTPTKSILKKKKGKNNSKGKKRVSFPLDENNDLINEVATYSNSKEPSQSLIDVQKTVGSFRSSEDSPSPVKLTLSLKKKVLMNLSLEDSDSDLSSSEIERSKFKKNSLISGQSTSQGISQGDMSNHAKIISEVLKKYPHLVKDKKNIRLKILKKGNDKNNSGKLVKSKIQYLVLNENEHKKSPIKGEKVSVNANKFDRNNSSHSSRIRFQCPECENMVFSSYFTFKKHVTSEHKDKSSSILANVENVPYACYTCFLNEPLEFSDYCSYQQHMKEVHSKRETRLCSICGYRPAKKLELAYHQYTEHNKVPRNISFPKCDLCDHVAINDAALLKHRSQHANSDNYKCSTCGVEFRSFGALQGHMQTKLCQNKPSVSHKCPYCPQTFARSYNLKAHCKSNHRAAYIAAQTASNYMATQTASTGVDNEISISIDKVNKVDDSETSREIGNGVVDGGLHIEQVCNSLTNLHNNPPNNSSTEAEALSSVANNLVASLGISVPEETVSHYMYTQGNVSAEKFDENMVARSSEVNAHLMDSANSVSGYPGNLSLCHDGTYTTQAPISTTAVGTFYPVGVVPGHLVQSQIVSGEILPSQVLPGCVNVASSAVIGASPHSWTYVTYQVPTSNEDLPTVISDGTNMTSISADQNSNGTDMEMPLANKDVKGDTISNVNHANCNSSQDQSNSLVVMTNTTTQIGINSNNNTTQNYDTFSSQFV